MKPICLWTETYHGFTCDPQNHRHTVSGHNVQIFNIKPGDAERVLCFITVKKLLLCGKTQTQNLVYWSAVYFRYRIGYSRSITTPNGGPWYLLQKALHQTQVTVVTKWPTKISERC